MKKFSDFKLQALKNSQVKKAYDNLEVEFQIINQMIEKRIAQKMSQKQLARIVGTQQSAISRLEAGNINPSLSFLKKVATGLHSKLEVKLVG